LKSSDGLLLPAPLGLMVRSPKAKGFAAQLLGDVGAAQTAGQGGRLVVKLVAYN